MVKKQDVFDKVKYDLVVIGGGPAGMMAAGRAGELGVRVLLIEKNKSLGVKLLITGNSRCNITNKADEPRNIADGFGKNGKFLFSSLYRFGVEEAITFFESRGLKTKIESGNKVFPESDKSQYVLDTLIKYLKKSGVTIKTNAEVKKIVKKKNKIEKIILANDQEVFADKFIICTGGKSYPLTGSTGDGYKWLKELGHTIVNIMPSLTPVIMKEKIVKELEGLSLKNVEISLYKENKKIYSNFGEAIFTADGMSGPNIFDISRKIGQMLTGKIKIRIDFKPGLDFEKLDQRIQRDFHEENNKMFKNSLDKLLPQKLIPVIIKLSGIDQDKKVHFVTKEERKKLLHLLKEFDLEVKGLRGFEKAMITAGGIKLSEVDPKTMKSKLIDNLYFAGEILDLDGPTGGYNLQVCWTTGYVAGESVSEN